MSLPFSPYVIIDPKDRWVPSKKLKKDDLPTFGRPTIATTGFLVIVLID